MSTIPETQTWKSIFQLLLPFEKQIQITENDMKELTEQLSGYLNNLINDNKTCINIGILHLFYP